MSGIMVASNRPGHTDLHAWAWQHADLHPESRELVTALLDHIDALAATLRRAAQTGPLWVDDLNSGEEPR